MLKNMPLKSKCYTIISNEECSSKLMAMRDGSSFINEVIAGIFLSVADVSVNPNGIFHKATVIKLTVSQTCGNFSSMRASDVCYYWHAPLMNIINCTGAQNSVLASK